MLNRKPILCERCGGELTVDNLRLALREAGKTHLDGTLSFFCPTHTGGGCTYMPGQKTRGAKWAWRQTDVKAA